MKRLVVLPCLVLAAVVAVPFVMGNYPLKWQDIQSRTRIALPIPFGGSGSAPAQAPGAGARPDAPVPVAQAADDPYPVNRVSAPWHAGMPELGIQVYWESNSTDTDANVWGKAQRIVNYVVGLRANSIAVSFPFFTDNLTASNVRTGRATPSPRRVEILAREAVRAGLRVTVRPLLDEQSLRSVNGWRGGILPNSVPTWFASYGSLLTPYLQVAERAGVSTFVIGAELNSMQKFAQWRMLLADARKIFPGTLAYDFNYDDFLRRATFPADSIGVDAYIAVKAPDTATATFIANSWDHTLNAKSRSPLSGVLLSEVGIGARKGAFSAPGDFTSTGTYDPQIQPTWYRGVCTVARSRHMAGIYFWKVDFDADPSKRSTTHTTALDFIGSTASEQAIRDCLSAWASS